MDGYARPLPTLTEARQESLFDHAGNVEKRRTLHQTLDTYLRRLLCRGQFGEVHVRFSIENGHLTGRVFVAVEQGHRLKEEDD
jgi:hypothetical protein